MPGTHSDKTSLLGFYADKGLLKIVDANRGSQQRSQFLRDAVVEYMTRRGVDVPDEFRHPPDRSGKGGPKKKRDSNQSSSLATLASDPHTADQEKFIADLKQEMAAKNPPRTRTVGSNKKLGPAGKLADFLKVPAQPRVKETESFLAKALRRGKNYERPLEDITDKVGVRFVVLLLTELKIIQEVVETSDLWEAEKARDFEAERI